MKKLLIALIATGFSLNAIADDSVDHSQTASKHSVLASVEGTSTAVSVASAVYAAPVIVGTLATVAALESIDSAIDESHRSLEDDSPTPLQLTDTVITRDPPPSKAMDESDEMNDN